MSVEPGFGGQTFIEKTYNKLKEIKNFINEEKLPTVIQIDGGINDLNSKELFVSSVLPPFGFHPFKFNILRSLQ